jgi:hypothetical protein
MLQPVSDLRTVTDCPPLEGEVGAFLLLPPKLQLASPAIRGSRVRSWHLSHRSALYCPSPVDLVDGALSFYRSALQFSFSLARRRLRCIHAA